MNDFLLILAAFVIVILILPSITMLGIDAWIQLIRYIKQLTTSH